MHIMMPCGARVRRIDIHITKCQTCLVWWANKHGKKEQK